MSVGVGHSRGRVVAFCKVRDGLRQDYSEYEGRCTRQQAYHRELCATFDFHLTCLGWSVSWAGLMIVPGGASPPALRVEVKCKCCGGVNFIDTGTHTCRRCALVRRKIPLVPRTREMASREYDYNGMSRQKNGRYSSSFNNLCELRGVPENIKRLNEHTQYEQV